jgi:HEPN domain-containing protein
MSNQQEERIEYWKTSAEHDFKVMEHLVRSSDFLWSLFVGHLCIEKLLKALYVKNVEPDAPRIHDLSRLAQLANLQLTEQQEDLLDTLTNFNIRTRYPDYQLKMYRLANEEYTMEKIQLIRELYEWLSQKI